MKFIIIVTCKCQCCCIISDFLRLVTTFVSQIGSCSCAIFWSLFNPCIFIDTLYRSKNRTIICLLVCIYVHTTISSSSLSQNIDLIPSDSASSTYSPILVGSWVMLTYFGAFKVDYFWWLTMIVTISAKIQWTRARLWENCGFSDHVYWHASC